jgi:hypothetical protein
MSEEVYTITHDSWAIQIGAFQSKTYAESFKKSLEKELGKDVQITVEGKYYRVRILGLTTRQEVDENVVKLNKLGFRELWIIHLIAMQQQRLLITREDSLARIIESQLSPLEKAQIQMGAFDLRSNAYAIRKSISAPLNEKVTIESKGKNYTLETPEEPVLDPTVLNAIKDLWPTFGKLETKDTWKTPPPKQVVEEPAVREPVVIPKAIVRNDRSVNVEIEKPVGLITEETSAVSVQSIALQVAIYYRESQALRAKRKIMSKLNLPVEIVKQFEYYHVIITGFTSREETYQYYPELAGMGYPGITLIPNYKRQEK